LIRKKFETIKNIETPKLTKSWKCSKFCYQGKNTFEGTNVLPIVENRPGQVTEQGQCMTMCEQLNYVLKHRPMESVISNMTAPGFTLDNYVTG